VDVIVAWPRTCDYPLFRAFLAAEMDRFERVIVVLTAHDGTDYGTWLRQTLHEMGVHVLDSPDGPDWRDAAVRHALTHSDAEWVWFTEQDFLVRDGFWDAMNDAMADRVVLGFLEGDRWHPASLLVRRESIDATSRYFGPDPVDHVWTFGRELEAIATVRELPHGSYEHLRGTTQNHYLIDQHRNDGVFRRDRFRDYLRDCLAAGVVLHPNWADTARREIAA
jgi:hypothetical protein